MTDELLRIMIGVAMHLPSSIWASPLTRRLKSWPSLGRTGRRDELLSAISNFGYTGSSPVFGTRPSPSSRPRSRRTCPPDTAA